METLELIDDFTNGRLEADKEDEFYLQLNSSEELRTKVKQSLALRSAITQNASYFNPPSEATAAIFAAVGIGGLIGSTASASATLATPAKIAGHSQFANRALLAFTSGILTLVVVLLLLKFNDFSKMESRNDEPSNKLENSLPAKLESSLNKSELPAPPTTNIKYILIKEVHPKIIMDNKKDASSEEDRNFSINNVIQEKLTKTDIFRPEFNYDNKKIQPLVINFDEIIKPSTPIGFSAELNSSSSWNFQKATISPHVLSQFNNSSITVLYEISDNIKLGGELKQETFFQKYRGLDSKGITNIYEQQPNFTTFSSLIRYTLNNWESFKLYAQLNLGGNKVGYVIRGIGGMSYFPYYDVSFNLGFEVSNLYYTYQSNGFNSLKFALFYGFGYHF